MKISYTTVLILALTVSAIGADAQDQQAGTNIAITAKRMIDVRSGKVIPDAVILIEGDQIKSAGSHLHIPGGTKVIALGDVTLLPGLIDAHTHLLHQYYSNYGDDDTNREIEMNRLDLAKRALLGVRLAREMLEAGFTSVRDLGNSGINADIALRDAIHHGDVAGPRMFVSTRAISPVGGQFQTVTPELQQQISKEYVQISDTTDARNAVQQAVRDGADCIKVIVNSGSRRLTQEELNVIVAEAKLANLTVAAHATDGDGPSMLAVRAGVSSVEHAYTVSDTVLKMMAEKNIFLVPTDAAGVPKYQARIKRALKAGVRIAIGSDIYYEYPGKTRGQACAGMYQTYVASGMTNLEVLQAATLNPADLLRNQSIGVIEAGRFADIIAVKGDPLKDISVLENVIFVMKGGRIYKQ